jgi:hypothetical protein
MELETMKRTLTLVATFCLALSTSAHATRVATGQDVTITSVQTHATLYGGCFARLDITQADLGLDCDFAAVAFDCLGTSGALGRSSSERNFSQAQLAFVTGNPVQVFINDAVKLNGLCLAERLDVLSATPAP